MAGNEAVIVELLGNKGEVVDMTTADATAISKGTLLKLSDARMVGLVTGAGDAFAGIAVADKEGSDGATNIGVYTKGIFDLYTSGAAIIAGELVMMSGANEIGLATAAAISGGAIVGKALETTAAGVEEWIEVAVGVY